MPNVSDRWAAGATYEDFMGRWSRALAPLFVTWLGAARGLHWLDVGCGTGSLTNAICAHADPASIVACDPAAAFIDFARERSRDPRVSFVNAGVAALPRRDGGYGSVSSLFALNFFPDAGAAVDEFRSVAAPCGTASACVWDYADGMQFLRRFWDAAVAMDPSARALDEGTRFPLCRPDALTALFRAGGLTAVRCEALETHTVFANFDDYWRPLLGGTGPAPTYVASLDENRRAALKRALVEMLRPASDGTISLSARAWAVRGTR
jgi:SAM-dependent methyltransferase